MDLDALFAEDMARLQQNFYYPRPVQPIRIEKAIPFNTSQQINIYGLAHNFCIDQ